MNPVKSLIASVTSLLKKETPTKVTAQEFLAMIKKNPSVFEHWETPLEITEFVDCHQTGITHLSQQLTFSGRNNIGIVADFSLCKKLKTATGTFHGRVSFEDTGIEKIENLHITEPDNNGWAATFDDCLNLQIATGTYPGFVSFGGSRIEKIENLEIQNPEKDDFYICFYRCPNLKTLKNWDITKKISIEPEKLEAELKRRAITKFIKETQAQELPFL
jgi:hypothetical protein